MDLRDAGRAVPPYGRERSHSNPGGTVMPIQETAIESGDDGQATEEFDTIVIGGGQAGLSVGYYLKRSGGLATEAFDTIVIGGGQAGLSVGYYLKRSGGSFVILDANERIGGSWRTRTWDSLRLFTPARYD